MALSAAAAAAASAASALGFGPPKTGTNWFDRILEDVQTGILTTDLETDDVKAWEMYFQVILMIIYNKYIKGKQGKEQYEIPENPFRLLIVVGEGDKDKTQLAANMVRATIGPFVEKHFGGDDAADAAYTEFSKFFEIKIVQGAESKKEYPEGCLTAYDDTPCKNPDFYIIKGKSAAQAIKDYTDYTNESSFGHFIGLKPPRDGMNAFELGADFTNFYGFFYGSFNFNTCVNPGVWNAEKKTMEYGGDDDVAKQATFYKWLASFKDVYVYETFHGIGQANTVSADEFEKFFADMSEGARKVTDHWNRSLGLRKAGQYAEQAEIAKAKFEGALAARDAGDDELCARLFKEAVQSLTWNGVNHKIIMSMSAAKMMQMVCADPGIIAFMTGKLECKAVPGTYYYVWGEGRAKFDTDTTTDSTGGAKIHMLKPIDDSDDARAAFRKSIVDIADEIANYDIGLSEIEMDEEAETAAAAAAAAAAAGSSA